MGAIVAAVVGSVIVEYSEPRYSFLVYSLVAFGGAVTASRINRNVENIDQQMAKMVSSAPVA